MFHDCGVHDIDMICWLFEEWPEAVFSMAHAHWPAIANINDVDTVAITMKFPSGGIGIIDLSRYAAYGYDQRLEVGQ